MPCAHMIWVDGPDFQVGAVAFRAAIGLWRRETILTVSPG